MNNYEHNLLVNAVNMYGNIDYEIRDLDEATDCLSYDEIMNAITEYLINHGYLTYRLLKDFMQDFYTMIPKTIDEVLN